MPPVEVAVQPCRALDWVTETVFCRISLYPWRLRFMLEVLELLLLFPSTVISGIADGPRAKYQRLTYIFLPLLV